MIIYNLSEFTDINNSNIFYEIYLFNDIYGQLSIILV